MKIILPSNGFLGTKWIDMREPNYGDLRKTITATNDEYLFKYEFVKGLCENFDPKTISMDDVEYLYNIAASAVTFNTLSFKVKCPKCGEEIQDKFSINEEDIPIVMLKKTFKKCKKVINEVEYTFHILSAADGVDIHTYAFGDDDEDKLLEEATVCKVLGYDITEENIEKVKNNIPIAIYVGCFLFIKANWHGMIMLKEVKCPKCKESVSTKFELNSNWVRMDVPSFVEQYAMIRDCLDFKSFLDFTVPELKNFVDYLNTEAKKNG